ncbi:MAG: sugar phosphate isomerase/epimerase [Clostridia bacterium]|nr:sugar phosphate isomerase/epimerase [Clostridia bacterium]
MKVVTQTYDCALRLGEERAVRLLCEAGFDGLDYSMMFMRDNPDYALNGPGYAKHVLLLKSIAESYGVTFEQAHAPFPSSREGDPVYNKATEEKLKRCLEICGLMGIKIIVVHPVYFKKNKFENNIEMYNRLLPYAKDFNVKIALENMWGVGHKGKIIPNVCSLADEFNEYVDALDKDWFTACLDLGHCGLVGSSADYMIKAMGKERIGCLHVHDNDGIHDDHTLPYTKSMDWESILKALAQIDYNGDFTFEADNYLADFHRDLLPAACKFMYELGRSMVSRIERYRASND